MATTLNTAPRADLDVRKDIRENIIKLILSSNEVNTKRSLGGTRITYRVDWNVLEFLRSEKYEEPNHRPGLEN
ncbi:hypothetical protein RRF57_009754 [Xylaria bambusicola]|uniref:Uncharacterized protein n=1 Tax=Xylaria bambusicola TaxID=326684 RepID=A0AAN7Z229_9PEZI